MELKKGRASDARVSQTGWRVTDLPAEQKKPRNLPRLARARNVGF
ncbi:MAG: hypothetical protein VYE13_02135 [Pseudomonadota bacterium]|nr:hypothetical protein [Pseudomonadota bacterium]